MFYVLFCFGVDEVHARSHRMAQMADTRQRVVRTKGCVLDDAKATDLFSSHIQRAYCSPKALWKLEKVNKSGLTSQWGVIEKVFPLLNDILEATGGRIPKSVSLHRQFRNWLISQELNWAQKDSERATDDLRTMFKTLLDFRRNTRSAPRNHGKLQILIDKFVVDLDPPKAPDPKHQKDPPKAPDPKHQNDPSDEDVSVMPIVPPKFDVVEVSDAEESDPIDFDTLESKLFAKTNVSPRPENVSPQPENVSPRPENVGPQPGLLDAKALALLVAAAPAAPSPSQYKTLGPKGKKKRKSSKGPDDEKLFADTVAAACAEAEVPTKKKKKKKKKKKGGTRRRHHSQEKENEKEQ